MIVPRTPNILVISWAPHDDSGVLLANGRAYWIELERLSRVRHHCDVELLTYAYRENKVSGVYGWHALESQNKNAICYLLRAGRISYGDLDYLEIKGAIIINRLGDIEKTSHHQNHAATAYYASSFEEAAVLVVDNFGSYRWDGSIMRETASFWRGEKNDLVCESTDFSPAYQFHHGIESQYDHHYSVGVFYQDLTILCWFSVQDGGKTMGLAPYGTDKIFNMLTPFYDIGTSTNGPVFRRGYNQFLIWLRESYRDIFSYRADVAYAAQKVLELVMMSHCERLSQLVTSENLCMSWGIMLNSVANGLILQKSRFKNIFVQPASNDAWQALGRALLVYHSRESERLTYNHYYLGEIYGSDDIENALRGFEDRIVTEIYEDENGLFRKIAEILVSDRVVWCFWWAAEFGPRALGNRSILCSPLSAGMRDHINANIKHREWFRPFAPVVIEERVSDFFDLTTPSPYMLLVARVKDSRIPAVTHVDGTARIQTITDGQNHRLYSILRCFGELTGIPVLLNTSFNINGQPIVETPLEAISTFLQSDLDFLIMDNRIISKK